IEGGTPFLDVTFTVKNDDAYDETGSAVQVNALNYETTSGSDTIRVLTTDGLTILPSQSRLYGYVRPEVFVEDGIVDPNKDMKELGAKVYAIDSDGNRYDAEIQGIYFEI